MAENTTIRNSFFDSLAKGAKWDVGVSINRTNPLPLDQYSVFKSETELDNYIAGAFAYPGQVLAVVGENETVIYYLDQNKEKQEVGSMPGVDNKSIKIKIDETTGEEYLTLVGLEGATTGASLIKLADGSIGWSQTTQEGLTADLTGIKSDISELNTTVYGTADGETLKDEGLVKKVESLETKFNEMGGVFNFAGSFTSDAFANIKAEDYDVGDVVLVDGKKEYLCVEKEVSKMVFALTVDQTVNPGERYYEKVDGKEEYVEVTQFPDDCNPSLEGYYIFDGVEPGLVKVWEQFGDPEGIAQLKETTSTHTSNITNLQSRMGAAEKKIGAEAKDGAAATGLYAYADTVAINKANAAQAAAEAAAEAALSPVATKANDNAAAITAINTSLELKANASDVESSFTAVNGEIAKKADAATTTEALNQRATKTELENGLNTKADKDTTANAIDDLDKRLDAAEGDIDKLEAAVGQAGTDGKYPTTSLTGRVEVLETTKATHTQDIEGLKAGLGSVADGTDKSTAFGKAAEAKALAGAANTAAGVAQAAAEGAQRTADGAQSAAGTAQSKADAAYALAETKVNNDTYVGKVAEIEGRLSGHDTAIDLKAEKTYVDGQLATKVDSTTYNSKIQEIEGKINLSATTEYVNTELAKKADANATATAINDINAKIGTLGNVMNFVGELEEITVTEGETTTTKIVIKLKEGETERKTPENGDVGFINTFEYVYIDNEWVKFGDTSAEAGRISALEKAVGDSKDGLVKDVADLKAEDTAIKNAATALSTSVDNRFTAVNGTLESLGTNKVDVSVYNEKIAALEAADAKEAKDRDDAVKKEASDRATAISNLETYFNEALAWGTF